MGGEENSKKILNLVWNVSLNPKDTGGDSHPQVTIWPVAPFLGIGTGPLISLNSCMSIPVVLPPFWGPPDARENVDPPGKLLDRQNFAKFWHIFEPPRVKISTLPPLYFMIYYIFCTLKKNKNWKKEKKNGIPLLGMAPRDPRVWSLEGPEG